MLPLINTVNTINNLLEKKHKFIKNIFWILDKITFVWFFEWVNMPFSLFSFTKCWFDLWLLGILITLFIYFLFRIFRIKKLKYKTWEYIIPIPDENWTIPMYLLHVSVFSGYFALFIDSQFSFYHFFYFCKAHDVMWSFIFFYTVYWFLLLNFFIIFDYSFLPSLKELTELLKNWAIFLKIFVFLSFVFFINYSLYFGTLELLKKIFG